MTLWENPMEDEMAKRAELVAAAKDLNVVLGCNPPIDVTKSVETIKEQLMSAGKLLNDDDKIEAVTRAVLDELLGTPVGDGEGEVLTEPEPESEAEEDETEESEETGEDETETETSTEVQPVAEADPPKRAGRKPPALGKFSPVRRGSQYAKILEAALPGPITLKKAAKAADVDEDKAVSVLKRARITNGIDFALDGDVLTVILPEGMDAGKVWHTPKERPAPSSSSGERMRYADDAVITMKVDKNPKQVGSAAHTRFAFYKNGIKVGQFLKAGGSRADLSWDTKKGFIEIHV